MNKIRITWRASLLVFAILVSVTSVSYRTGHVGPNDFLTPTRAAADIRPQGWKKLDVEDWLQLANRSNLEGQLPQVKAFTLQALSNDLSNGDAMAQLALTLIQQGDKKQAEHLAELAGQLATARNSTHTYLSAFWKHARRQEKVLEAWNILLTRTPELRADMFPHLQALILAPQTTHLLDTFAQQAPVWWADFFTRLANDEKTPLDLLVRLHNLRTQSDQPLSDSESTSYVARLLKNRRWAEAHDAWITGLPTDLRGFNGLVYDGGFEGVRHNTGFDWFFQNDKQVKVQTSMTFGIQGRRALRIDLNNSKHIKFQHVWQRLTLQPANYQLRLRFRADSLRTTKGLLWRLRCMEDDRVLADSTFIRESTPWSNLSVDFTIPPNNCSIQQLRLEAVSSYAHEQVFAGTLWFDDIEIHKQAISE